MPSLTTAGQQRINELAQRYNVSNDAVMTLLQALLNGNTTMAQFNHPELGGSGQWLQGGMIMIGDMFNNALKSKVDNLCVELSQLLQSSQVTMPAPTSYQSQSQGGQSSSNYGTGYSPVSLFIPNSGSGNWWPAELGIPNASGAQNNQRYAYFANSRRLAININGQISVYDTQNHQIGGVSQQQGSGASWIFTSQYGTVDVLNLPLISGPGTLPSRSSVAPVQTASSNQSVQEEDIFAKIERLAALKQKGVISEEEFATKKAELLSRL
jgi:hypothetical protein